MSDRKHLRVYIPRIIGGILAALAIFYLVKIINEFIDEKPVKHDKKIQAITLLKPPPPPPPPPKVEKPPEPEVKEKIKEIEPEPEPEQKPDEQPPDAEPPGPPGNDLPGSSDGTEPLGRPGQKRQGNPYAWYGSLVKNDIVRQLSNHDELRRKAYAAIVKIWLKPDGSIERVELANGSNDAEIDKILTRLLNKLDKINEPLPPGLPQPIKLKISSRI